MIGISSEQTLKSYFVLIGGLRQLLATECSLKKMKNAFYFILKAVFVLKILKTLLFGLVEKRLA